jgi:hypothetical protein
MPRKSADERAAGYFRTGGKGAEPPRDLSAFAKQLWRGIVASRPPEFFPPGQQELLRQFCELSEMRRFYRGVWERDRDNAEYVKAMVALANAINATAVKLRISNSSAIDKRSGILSEREPELGGDSKGKTLFGTDVVKLRGGYTEA